VRYNWNSVRLGRLKVGGTLCVQSGIGVGVTVVWKRERKTPTLVS